MLTKKRFAYFCVLFIPVLVVSMLLTVAYSLSRHNDIQVNWPITILLSVVLDAFLTWVQTRKDEDNKPNNFVH
jgi:hypothetical protein